MVLGFYGGTAEQLVLNVELDWKKNYYYDLAVQLMVLLNI